MARDQESQVGADHEQRAVRQIDDAHDAEDQRQSARDQEKQQAVLHAIEKLCEQARKIHAGVVRTPGRAGGAARADAAHPARLHVQLRRT